MTFIETIKLAQAAFAIQSQLQRAFKTSLKGFRNKNVELEVIKCHALNLTPGEAVERVIRRRNVTLDVAMVKKLYKRCDSFKSDKVKA